MSWKHDIQHKIRACTNAAPAAAATLSWILHLTKNTTDVKQYIGFLPNFNHLLIIVAYFNLKNLFSNKSSLVEDAKAINSLATKIIVVLIITILIVLATIVGA